MHPHRTLVARANGTDRRSRSSLSAGGANIPFRTRITLAFALRGRNPVLIWINERDSADSCNLRNPRCRRLGKVRGVTPRGELAKLGSPTGYGRSRGIPVDLPQSRLLSPGLIYHLWTNVLLGTFGILPSFLSRFSSRNTSGRQARITNEFPSASFNRC